MGFKETGTALAGFIWLMIGDQWRSVVNKVM
jgi:hypothetical protein